MSWPETDELIEIISSDSMEGWCTECEDWTHDCCEPDTEKAKCPDCGENTVYGAEECLIHIVP